VLIDPRIICAAIETIYDTVGSRGNPISGIRTPMSVFTPQHTGTSKTVCTRREIHQRGESLAWHSAHDGGRHRSVRQCRKADHRPMIRAG
jgi:hypothetical protein